MTSQPLPEWLTPQQACAVLGISDSTLSEWVRLNKIPVELVKHIGKVTRVHRSFVDPFYRAEPQSLMERRAVGAAVESYPVLRSALSQIEVLKAQINEVLNGLEPVVELEALGDRAQRKAS